MMLGSQHDRVQKYQDYDQRKALTTVDKCDHRSSRSFAKFSQASAKPRVEIWTVNLETHKKTVSQKATNVPHCLTVLFPMRLNAFVYTVIAEIIGACFVLRISRSSSMLPHLT